MPIENERKIVLRDPERVLEAALAVRQGVRRQRLRQAYLDAAGVRIREIVADDGIARVFSYKRPVDGQMVEIETAISKDDFARLWTLRRETLEKTRYSWTEGSLHWDVDFFGEPGRPYFTMAEVEMPADRTELPALPPELARHSLHIVEAGDARFTSKRLADPGHAAMLFAALIAGVPLP
ncbi:MAG: hypothetical protein FJX02_11710 [Alphaproteobacteria bacterium]|nr:hypothetical protein [Alphaproteobacteria bacterium]